jgi:hypothetical protein
VNQRENIAGAGINIAQRVMDCGDAGHILLSNAWRTISSIPPLAAILHDLAKNVPWCRRFVVNPMPMWSGIRPAQAKMAKCSPTRSIEGKTFTTLNSFFAGLMLFSVAVLAIIRPAILK